MHRGWLTASLLSVVACGGRSAETGPGATLNAGGAGVVASSLGGDSGASARGGSAAVGATGGRAGLAGGGSAAGNSAIGGSAAVAGNGGAAGSVDTDGGAGGEAGAADCAPGTVRCNSVRERCGADGTWAKEDFVCAVDISGSTEENMACAVKSDGRLSCFGDAFNPVLAPLNAGAPDRPWAKVFLADDPNDGTSYQVCAIDRTGQGACWGSQSPAAAVGSGLLWIANGTYGLCTIGAGGASYCPMGQQLTGAAASSKGPFQELVIRNNWLFALGVDGSLTVPYPEFDLPVDVYTQFSATNQALCAIDQAHKLSCAPTAVPAELASQRFTQVAVEYYGSMCAIAEDQSIACAQLGANTVFTPLAGQFTRIVATESGMCGIRTDGSIGCFGMYMPTILADW